MEIAGISANDPVFSPTTEENNETLGRDAFMQLLVNQLKNQDPLQPTQNEDFVAQLAQFSQLEGIDEINDNIVGLAVLQQGNAQLAQLTEASALIDKSVTYFNPSSGLQSTGTVDSVRIEDGFALLNIGGESVPLANLVEVTNQVEDGVESVSTDETGDDAQAE